MATVVSQTLDKNNRRARLAVAYDTFLLFDQTNKRMLSGLSKVTLNSLTFSPALSGSEKAKVTVAPPNFNAACHDKTEYEASGSTGLPSALYHAVAYNYGQFGPSANVNSDGMADLIYVDIELPEGCATSTVATLDYTLGGVSIDPYNALSSATVGGTVSLTADKEAASVSAIVSIDKPTSPSTYIGYAALQLSSLDFTRVEGATPEMAPQFVVSNPGEQPICSINFLVPQGHGRSRVLHHSYTYVFAINGTKVDANAQAVQLPRDSKTVLNLLNAAIVREAGSQEKVVVSMPYLGKIAQV